MTRGERGEGPGHEEKCRRCGRCCYQKLEVEGAVIYTDVPCAYLDVETRLCTVYERRREVNPDCLSVAEGIERGVFPADCPYVAGVEGYVPPVEDPGPELLGEASVALAGAGGGEPGEGAGRGRGGRR